MDFYTIVSMHHLHTTLHPTTNYSHLTLQNNIQAKLAHHTFPQSDAIWASPMDKMLLTWCSL